MPEIEDPATSTKESRSEYSVSLVLQNRGQQPAEFLRVILQIGVLHYEDFPGGVGNSSSNRSALSAVHRLMDHHINETLDLELLQDLATSIGRTIVDADNFGRQLDLPD